MCEILSRKAVTDKQAIYIFNNVFLPRIQYRLSVTILSDTEINAIVSRYAGVVKQKVELAHGTPLSILFHRRLYGLRHLGDAQIEEQVSTAQLRLNDHSLLGKVVTTRAMALQAECRLTVSPFSVPALGSLYTRHNLLGHICRLLVDRGITFLSPTSVVDATRLIGPLLPPGVYPKVAHQLFLDGVASLDEVVSEDGLSLASWTELRERLALHQHPNSVTTMRHRWTRSSNDGKPSMLSKRSQLPSLLLPILSTRATLTPWPQVRWVLLSTSPLRMNSCSIPAVHAIGVLRRPTRSLLSLSITLTKPSCLD